MVIVDVVVDLVVLVVAVVIVLVALRNRRLKVNSDNAAGTDQFIVYNQSKSCSFRPRVSGGTPGADKGMPAGTPAQACLQERLHRHACSNA